MESAWMNRIMALAFLFLGLTIFLWLLSMVFNMTFLVSIFMVCGFISAALIIVSALFIWMDTREESV